MSHLDTVDILLSGDVMLGRGVDQILPHPGDPRLRERYVRDARTYVELAENRNGPIPHPVDFAWPWGDALAMLDRLMPDVRLINLETAITAEGRFDPHKGIHYRMTPANLPALSAIRPHVCTLANNHVLDFGRRGLADTLDALTRAGVHGVGAGRDVADARRPVVVEVRTGRRVVIVACATESSGVPPDWAATANRSGVNFVTDMSNRNADQVAARVRDVARPGDVAVVSIHWGSNWGYAVEARQERFAHRLIDAGIDVVHGHSSHHPRPIEIYRGKPILYGCGDAVDDYEGIHGHETYRGELRLLYLVSVDPDARLVGLRMVPLRERNMRLELARSADAEWLRSTLTAISSAYDTRVLRVDDLLVVALS